MGASQNQGVIGYFSGKKVRLFQRMSFLQLWKICSDKYMCDQLAMHCYGIVAKSKFCFIRVPVKNSERWMEIIRSTYPEGEAIPSSRVHVCDLHFDANLIGDAVPNMCVLFNKLNLFPINQPSYYT